MARVRHKGRNTRYRVGIPLPGCLPSSSAFFVFSRVELLSDNLVVGVMRFLQTEWHRHERDRNAWQIERAEMKSRIGKLEGDLRTNKKLRESMDKHIRMLENALRKKNQEQSQAAKDLEDKPKDASETKTSAKSSPGLKRESTSRYVCQRCANKAAAQLTKQPHNSFLDIEHDEPQDVGLRHEEERDRSRMYLGKCIEEFAYHVFSTVNTQQQFADEEPMLQNHQYQNHQPQQQHPSLEDVYVQNQQKQQRNNVGALGPSPLPNHQPPPIPRVNDVPPLSRGLQPQEERRDITRIRELRQSQQQGGSLTTIERSSQSTSEYGFPDSESQIEKVAHSYDSYGRPVPSRDEEDQSRISEEPEATDTDGWNFDDPPELSASAEEPAPDYASAPQRPDTDVFPIANDTAMKSPTRGLGSHKRKSSLSRRRQSDGTHELRELSMSHTGGSFKGDPGQFKVRFALRGHLDVVRSVVFTGGGSPAAPEICTAGDDGVIKRWIAASAPQKGDDLDLRCDQTHRGHTGAVLCLAASPTYQPFSNGGRAQGDGWVFSGGEDTTVRVWERGRVDPKATLDGHTDAVWTVCVLPGTSGSVLGDSSVHHGGPDRALLASGGADGTILVWSVSSPPRSHLRILDREEALEEAAEQIRFPPVPTSQIHHNQVLPTLNLSTILSSTGSNAPTIPHPHASAPSQYPETPSSSPSQTHRS